MKDEGPEGSARSVPVTSQLAYLVERQRFAEAKRLLGNLLAERPEDPDLLFYGAYIDHFEKRPEQAMETVQKVLSLDPHHESARRLLFGLHNEARRFAEAERVLIDLIKDYPEDADLYAQYSMLMLETQHLEKAQKLAEEAVRLAPDDEQALLASALCAFVADPSPETNHRLQELIRRYPDSMRTLITMIVVLADRRRHKEALLLSQELLRAYPDNEDVVNLVVALKVQNHWSLKPLWPMQRFGWAGSAGLWVVIVGLFAVLPRTPLAPWEGPIFAVVLTYIVYSWVYPPILNRLMRR